MPYAAPGDVHVSGPLSNVAVRYTQQQRYFVADRVFPLVAVSKQSDLYYVFDRAEANRDEMQLRAPATESAGGTLQQSTQPYYARVWAFHYDIPDPIRANADSPLEPDRAATRNVIFKALLKREVLFAQNFMATGVWGYGVTGAAATPASGEVVDWSDAASTPIEDVAEALTTVQMQTGLRPNKFVMGQQVWDALKNHPDIIDRIKYSSGNDNPAIVNLRAIAALFEVDEIFVMGAIQNSGQEGAAESNAFLAGKDALLLYAPSSASLIEPSAGYTFAWTGLLGSSAQAGRIKKFRLEHLEVDRVEIEMAFDQKKTAADLGYFFNDIVA
jgi:hypothetical protein